MLLSEDTLSNNKDLSPTTYVQTIKVWFPRKGEYEIMEYNCVDSLFLFCYNLGSNIISKYHHIHYNGLVNIWYSKWKSYKVPVVLHKSLHCGLIYEVI